MSFRSFFCIFRHLWERIPTLPLRFMNCFLKELLRLRLSLRPLWFFRLLTSINPVFPPAASFPSLPSPPLGAAKVTAFFFSPKNIFLFFLSPLYFPCCLSQCTTAFLRLRDAKVLTFSFHANTTHPFFPFSPPVLYNTLTLRLFFFV